MGFSLAIAANLSVHPSGVSQKLQSLGFGIWADFCLGLRVSGIWGIFWGEIGESLLGLLELFLGVCLRSPASAFVNFADAKVLDFATELGILGPCRNRHPKSKALEKNRER